MQVRFLRGWVADRYYRLTWRSRGFSSPNPRMVKRSVLRRYSRVGDVWIETGTYRGDTTAWLSRRASEVHSIEPSPRLASAANKRFRKSHSITIHRGESEAILSTILPNLSGNVSFWLDGHYSGPGTFQGVNYTPIIEELKAISEQLDRFGMVTICIDDFRLFPNKGVALSGSYPERGFLVSWALNHGLNWSVENDIFVMYSPEHDRK